MNAKDTNPLNRLKVMGTTLLAILQNKNLELTVEQIDALKRLEYFLPSDGYKHCPAYYCPQNISRIINRTENGLINVHTGALGQYHGAPDGLDSECPRFRLIDRENSEWKCLSGLEIIADLMERDPKELYEELRPHFSRSSILGYNPTFPNK